MDNDNELSDDFNRIKYNFFKFQKTYLKEQNLRKKYLQDVKNLKEENRIIQEVEKAEQNKLKITRQLVEQQQDNISNLLSVKSMV
ncbi:hypothetical protein L9F63_017172 [Diploptera punctata]|uniref:Uncharacterized protein n=1 Tax=Diploptera punctata TaxID=6984 RepID=A0AAD8EHB7_DIPPU|nr:hypothetical protein L9F63_017172 [Diploptera punctata]